MGGLSCRSDRRHLVDAPAGGDFGVRVEVAAFGEVERVAHGSCSPPSDRRHLLDECDELSPNVIRTSTRSMARRARPAGRTRSAPRTSRLLPAPNVTAVSAPRTGGAIRQRGARPPTSGARACAGAFSRPTPAQPCGWNRDRSGRRRAGRAARQRPAGAIGHRHDRDVTLDDLLRAVERGADVGRIGGSARVGDRLVELGRAPTTVVVRGVRAEQDAQEVVRTRVVGDPRERPDLGRICRQPSK